MSDHVDRAVQVIEGHVSTTLLATDIAQELDVAGLLAKYPHLEGEGDWLIEVVNYHTCGAGPGSGAGHEPGCGTIPVGRLVTPEHDAAVAAKALREAADGFSDPDNPCHDPEPLNEVAQWLRLMADERIERTEATP